MESLAVRLQRGPLDTGEALRLAGDLCAALRPLHARRHIAGELLPDRIVWNGERWVIEWLQGRPGDEREDVHAVGAMVHHALGAPPPLALPEELRAPVTRSLHVRPERRHGTVEDLARALGVATPAPPPRPRRIPPLLPPLVAALAAGALTRMAEPPARAVVAAPVPAAPAPAPARIALRVGAFSAPGGEDAWLGDGVADMLSAVLAERPGLALVDDEGEAAVLAGKVDRDGDGLVVEVRLVAGGATRFAERLAVPAEAGLLEAVDALADRLARGLGGGPGPRLAGLTTGSVAAYRAYVEGDGARAAALDPTFFQARARLGDLAAARALVGRAGRRGAAMLERLETAARARDGRAQGRWSDCAADAERAGLPVELAWCRLGLGDADGARAAARAAGDPLLAGDLELLLGHHAEARAAYAQAGAGGAARLALVELRARGRCKTPVAMRTVGDALVEAALARACGDWDRAHAAEAFVARGDRALAEELAVARAAARGERGAWERARKLVAERGAGGQRGRRLGAVFAAARASGHGADALAGFAAEPGDRWGLFDEPLLFQVALAQLDAGDAEAGALACAEVAASDPGLPALYCTGRAAEAAGDVPAAFRAYRELLDRATDASEENRLVRDAARRLRLVIAQAHHSSQG